MHQKTRETIDQVILPVSPHRHWRRSLTAVGLLLALGYGGLATAAAPPAHCGKRTATIVGTNKAETIVGTAGPDVIQARYGDDKIYGLEGNDVICSSLGSDTVYGGYGDMPVSPAPASGNDRLLAGDNMDKAFGEDGDDFVDGGCPCPARDFPSVKDQCDGGPGTKDIAQNCEIKTNFP